jgi:site-specific recombinase XerD
VSLKTEAALSTAYGARLRASEMTPLKVTDINSQRRFIHIEQGKGGRDRQAILSHMGARRPCAAGKTVRTVK